MTEGSAFDILRYSRRIASSATAAELPPPLPVELPPPLPGELPPLPGELSPLPGELPPLPGELLHTALVFFIMFCFDPKQVTVLCG